MGLREAGTAAPTRAATGRVHGSDAFIAVSPGLYRLEAPLSFDTVPHLRSHGLALIAAAPDGMTLDLKQVPMIDSAGLALLIDWLAAARALRRSLRYAQPPQALLSLARLSEVESLIIDSAAGS